MLEQVGKDLKEGLDEVLTHWVKIDDDLELQVKCLSVQTTGNLSGTLRANKASVSFTEENYEQVDHQINLLIEASVLAWRGKYAEGQKFTTKNIKIAIYKKCGGIVSLLNFAFLVVEDGNLAKNLEDIPFFLKEGRNAIEKKLEEKEAIKKN